MKEAHELLEVLNRYDTFTNYDLPVGIVEKMQALKLALECEPENYAIVRYRGIEVVYLIDEPSAASGEFEADLPIHVRQQGILHALRHILEVPELASILATAATRMRELKRLKDWRDNDH